MIDGNISNKQTKMYYEQIAKDEVNSIYFEVQMNDRQIKSKLNASMEYAIKYLQKELPNHISIACCQSCLHGNFNPFGDVENEIFCLKDKRLNNRADVVEWFSTSDLSLETRRRKLLDFCSDFKHISQNEKYTYNDWDSENL